jgi:hypothetical protein
VEADAAKAACHTWIPIEVNFCQRFGFVDFVVVWATNRGRRGNGCCLVAVWEDRRSLLLCCASPTSNSMNLCWGLLPRFHTQSISGWRADWERLWFESNNGPRLSGHLVIAVERKAQGVGWSGRQSWGFHRALRHRAVHHRAQCSRLSSFSLHCLSLERG